MENNILKHRMAVMNNIAKSFGYEKSEDLLEKAEDNDIEKAKHQDGDMHPNGKWVWRASANGGKGDWRVAKKTDTTSSSSKETSNKFSDKKSNTIDDSESSDWFYAIPIDRPGSKAKPLQITYHHFNIFVSRSPDGKSLEVKRGGTKRFSREETEKFAKVLKEAYKELGSYEKLEYYTLDSIERELNNKSNKVIHDINGTKVTVTKNSDGSYTLEANGKKVKSDDPSFFVNGTNLKPRVKAALAKEVGLETKKKGKIPDESEVKSMMQWMSKKNGSNWTVEDRDKAMEFMSRVPSKFKSSNRNIINALNATLKNLYIEHNK